MQRRGEIERRALSTPSAEESRGSFSGEIERSRSLYIQEYTEESRGSLSGEIERRALSTPSAEER